MMGAMRGALLFFATTSALALPAGRGSRRAWGRDGVVGKTSVWSARDLDRPNASRVPRPAPPLVPRPSSLVPPQSFPISAGVRVEPDTVRIGDPFTVTVAVRAPRGASMTFPDPPDSTATVQALDPRRVARTSDTTADEEYAVYRVAAWDLGAQPIRLGDVVVRFGGLERRVPLAGYSVFVASVLPADTTLRVPKPARPIYDFGQPTWWWWLAALAALAILALLVWWLRRWLRRRRMPVPVDPFEHAEREFQRVESLGLVEAGERARHVALLIEILRDYLAARYAEAPLALTSTELLGALRGSPFVPYDRLSRVLEEADLVKFARRPLSAERARELGREARGIVVSEHHAERAAAAAAEAAEKAA